jgi:hypothetical protein
MATATGIDKYINDILTKIYANQNLCKLLLFDDYNPLSHSDLVDTTILRTDKTNQRLYITPFSIDIEDKVKSKLHIMINNFELDKDNRFYVDLEVDFIICINVKIWEINDGSNEVKIRANLIMQELLETFNRQRCVGMGINNFKYGKIQKFNEWFWGYTVVLSGMDLPTRTLKTGEV